jgi:hypothetical protein
MFTVVWSVVLQTCCKPDDTPAAATASTALSLSLLTVCGLPMVYSVLKMCPQKGLEGGRENELEGERQRKTEKQTGCSFPTRLHRQWQLSN